MKHAKVIVSRAEAHSTLWEKIAGLKATAKLLFHEQIYGALDDLLLARRTLLAAATMHARTNNVALRERARLMMFTPWLELDENDEVQEVEDQFFTNLTEAEANLHSHLACS